MNRDEAVKLITSGLKARSKTPFSVRVGRGTGSGWIHLGPAPRVQAAGAEAEAEAMAELVALLGLRAGRNYVSVPASSDHYEEFAARAQGKTPTVYGQQYWD